MLRDDSHPNPTSHPPALASSAPPPPPLRRLPTTLDEILGYLQQRRNRQGPGFTYEVVVVDDGSRDGTVAVASEYARKHGTDAVRVLQVRPNRGKGNAVRRGMLNARGEYCLFADADGATRFCDVEKLEAALAGVLTADPGGSPSKAAVAAGGAGSLGVAVGSRSHLERAAAAKRSPLRNFLTKGFHALVWFVAGGAIRDTQCGFKLFTRRAAASLFANQRLQRFSFDVELLFLAHQLGVPAAEVAVQWTEIPGSKIRPSSVLHMALELLAVKTAYQWLGSWRAVAEAELLAAGPSSSSSGSLSGRSKPRG